MANVKALNLGTGGNLTMKDGSALHTETMETIGGTASKAYSVGEYFIGTDGLMYQTTTAITSGDTIVLNTNCVKSDLTNVLNTNNVIRPTIVIPDNSDIDDYTTPGVYSVASLESAATMSNLPNDVTGKLIVAFNTLNGSSITQIYFEAFTNNIHSRKWDRYEARWTDWARLAKKQELDARILVGAHNLAEPYEQVAIFGNDDEGFSFSYNATSLGYVAKVSPGVTYVIKKSSSYGNRFRIIGFSTKPAINTTIPGVQILNNSSMNEYKFTNSPGYSYLWITANYNSAVDFDAVEGQVFIADDEYSEYLPYTKTNRELTEEIANCITSAGGTLTGSIGVNGDIHNKNTEVDVKQTNNGVASGQKMSFTNFIDKNGVAYGGLQTNVKSDGTNQILLTIKNYDSSATEITRGIVLSLDKSGNFTYIVNDGNNLLAALGMGYGTCATAEATTEKAVVLANFTLCGNAVVTVKFTNAVPANATMNINSKGAKPIYYRGAAITANKIKAGDTCMFVYTGGKFNLISNDGWGSNY